MMFFTGQRVTFEQREVLVVDVIDGADMLLVKDLAHPNGLYVFMDSITPAMGYDFDLEEIS